MKTSGKLALVLLMLSSVGPAAATTFIVPTDRELVGKSTAIVRGTVERSYVERSASSVETVYEIRVDGVYKGHTAPNELIRVSSPGGQIGSRVLSVPGSAHFAPGEKTVLFLTADRGNWRVTDMTLGKFKPMKGDGERVLVRESEPLSDLGFGVIGNRDGVRNEDKFLRFIEGVVAGKKVNEDYVSGSAVSLVPVSNEEAWASSAKVVAHVEPYSAQSYTMMGASAFGVRWPIPEMTAGVTFFKQASQNIGGAGDGGVSAIQSSLNAWANDCGSIINLPYGGTTAVVAGATNADCGICDQINVVEFNDPQGKIAGSFVGSGTVAVTFVVFDTVADGTGFRRIYDADVVVQDGFTAANSGFATALTHEIGHGIGWRHSNADPSTPNGQTVSCNSAEEDCTPTNTAIMFFQASGGFGFNLQPWDVNAARAVYPGGSCAAVKRDFNGDLRGDVFWRHSSGLNAIWFMNGLASPPGAFTESLDASWSFAGSGDFNGDGRADIFWRHSSGLNAIWTMNGTTATGAFTETLDLSWTPVAVADFNGDGRADIFWRHNSGTNAIWAMNGASNSGSFTTALDPSWSVRAVGDFSGDGKADILWRHTSGLNAVWIMNGSSVTSGTFVPSLDGTWAVGAAGDFNGDNKTDILWRHITGLNAIWFMDGAALSPSSGYTTSLDPLWALTAAADFNGDGKTDLLWRLLPSGTNAIWQMNGLGVTGAFVPTLDGSWVSRPNSATNAQ